MDKTFDEVHRLIDDSVADLNQHIDEAEDAQANEDIKARKSIELIMVVEIVLLRLALGAYREMGGDTYLLLGTLQVSKTRRQEWGFYG